ncbi:T9SS type A sorting domain-containing protein [Rhodohalobacter sp. SW132]|uniref:T9SS type A sorting domain-containing protein n=1 Tax=Rhodohalobacter sp. SW132 TaxID=2293433 RepID=UPI001314B875|nr:T9SS type A sorting domain-containing protein [Rhodohalobacter sp. SW132]
MAFSQHNNGEQNHSTDSGLMNQVNQLQQKSGEDLNRVLKKNTSPSTTSFDSQFAEENERWSGEFGEAYIQEIVFKVKEYQGDLYIAGDIEAASDGTQVVSATGLVKWDGESYSTFPGEFDGPVFDIAFIDGNLFIGGAFSSVTVDGEVTELNHIAKWDGESWSPLDGGTDGNVWALLAVNNTLYVGGDFEHSNGDQVASPYISRWSENSESWSSLSGMELNSVVQTLTTDGSNIIAGGDFSNNGLNRIAMWDGSDWEPLGDGFNNFVTDILIDDDLIYAAGRFDERGDGTTLRYIGVYDLSEDLQDRNWKSPGQSSPDEPAIRMSMHNGELVIGGEFQNIGINEIRGVATLNDGQWQPIGNGIDGAVTSVVHNSDGTLYAGGVFESANGISSPNFSMFNGSEWQRVGSQDVTLSLASIDNGSMIFDVAWYQGDLYVTGFIDEIGGIEVSGIARWDGETWHDLDGGLTVEEGGYSPAGSSLLVHDGNLYVGGQFEHAGSLPQPANGIARWNGQEWSRLGSGITSDIISTPYIWDLAEFDGNIYAVGEFTEATGMQVNSVAYWNGSDWFDVGNGTANNDLVRAIYKEGDTVFIGGSFQSVGSDDNPIDATGVAAWSETDQEWSPLGNGLDGNIFYLTRYKDELIAAGEFTNQGASANLSGIAAWDPVNETWSDFQNADLSDNTTITSLVNADETLYVAGSFESINGQKGVNSIASFSQDEGWNPLGDGITVFGHSPGTVLKISHLDDKLWTTGMFTQAGNKSAHTISNWDLQIVDVSIDEPIAEEPKQFQLDQNYPNPFNPATTIHFALEDAADVQLRVYDMAGREVATIVDNRMSSGSHSVNFDASRLSSGVYLYRLEATLGSGQSFTQSRKMTLIK